jgi:hypothetical protein
MSRGRWTEGALFALATLGSGAFALSLGQDVNFDQLSYHVYLGWSLVAGRLDLDIAPAGYGAYLNPLLQTVHYLGLTSLPPRLFAFLLGALHGLNVFLVYRLSRHVLRGGGRERTLSAVAGLVAAAGPCAVSLLATTFGDNLLSVLVLAAFLLLLQVAEAPERTPLRRLVLAGALGGAAFGLKLTCAPALFALLVAAVFLAFRHRRARMALALGAGSLLGASVTAGYWSLQGWRRFGNPLFPFANAIFGSPYQLPPAVQDPRWAARGFTDLVATPLSLALGQAERLQEIPIRDLRTLVLFGLAAVVLVRILGRRKSPGSLPPGVPVLVLGWLALYGAWAIVFHYYRYFAAGEFLAPVVILALLRMLGPRRLPIVWPGIAAVVLLTTIPGSWGRAGWTDAPLRVQVPFDPAQTPAVVLVDGFGSSFALPFFPPGVRFFGVTATGEAFERLVARELERHEGPVFRLRLRAFAPTPLSRLGYVDAGSCEEFRTQGRGRLSLCRLERVPPPPG